MAEEIESSLNDCEKLVSWELELEIQLKNKNHLIEEHKHLILQITDSIDKNKIIELEEQTQQNQLLAFEQLKKQMQNLSLEKAKLEGKVLAYEKLIPVDLKEQLVLDFTNNPLFIKELMKRIYDYFNSKQIFINNRKEIIILLKEVVNIMEKKTVLTTGKYVMLAKGSRLVTVTLKIADIATPLINANELITESFSIFIDTFKEKFNEKSSEVFKEHLIKNDNTNEIKKERILLTEFINNSKLESVQLIKNLFNLNGNLFFNEEYEVYRIATNIWDNKPIIIIDDMKGAISDLTKNLHALERELKNEMNEINKLNKEIVSLDSHCQSVSNETQLMTCSIQTPSL